MPIALRLVPILRLLAPPACWCCHASAPPAEPLCRACRARLRFLGPDVRPVGGVPVWAAVAYDGPARSLVHGLKYRGAAGLADAMAKHMAANVPGELLTAVPAIDGAVAADAPPASTLGAAPALVPVPASPARARRRGYDQAALLAEALGRRTALPIAACLSRAGGGASQVGRGRAARLNALAGSIRVRSAAPTRALLVDDVATTGATLSACAEALGAAGCAQVAAVVYARTPGR